VTFSANSAIAAIEARRPGLKLGKKHSLLWFIQGHHLAHFGTPLFDEPIHATERRTVTIAGADGAPCAQPDREGPLNTIGYVIERYGSLSPADLRTLIRASQPWLNGRVGCLTNEVDLDDLRDWFLRDDETNDPDDERPNRAEKAAIAQLWRHRNMTTDFSEMSLAAGGAIRHALLDEHRVLTCMAGYHNFFVIAHTDDTVRARQIADELHARYEGLRDVHLVLITDEMMTALAAHVVINAPVLIAANGYDAAPTAIQLYNTGQITMPTEHGEYLTDITTSRELRAGDLYTLGAERLAEDTPGFVIFRARADYNPATGEVVHHIADRGFNPGPGVRSGAITDGPDQIVFRIVERPALIKRLNLDDVQPLDI
jgi:hypothetical protein